jgi:hypothetical protein
MLIENALSSLVIARLLCDARGCQRRLPCMNGSVRWTATINIG